MVATVLGQKIQRL